MVRGLRIVVDVEGDMFELGRFGAEVGEEGIVLGFTSVGVHGCCSRV